MKKLFLLIGFLFVGKFAFSAGAVFEQPINGSNSVETVKASTSAWTAAWSSSYAGMTGVYITNKSTNTADMYMTIEASAPTGSILFGPIVLRPAVTQFHNIANNMTIYLRSLATSSEYADFLRVKQQ